MGLSVALIESLLSVPNNAANFPVFILPTLYVVYSGVKDTNIFCCTK